MRNVVKSNKFKFVLRLLKQMKGYNSQSTTYALWKKLVTRNENSINQYYYYLTLLEIYGDNFSMYKDFIWETLNLNGIDARKIAFWHAKDIHISLILEKYHEEYSKK